MLHQSKTRFILATAAMFVISASSLHAAETGLVTIGDARFTIITPNCIRLEYAAGARFVDEPSMFAINRDARYRGYTLSTKNGATLIETSAIRLAYKPDGKPFSAANLQATIRKGAATVEWQPGKPNPGNLGGTDRTLDGWGGANHLPDGLISRDGWYLLDDSRRQLLTVDWVKSRPKEDGLDWYLFGYGDDYKAALKSLTTIGGPVPLPRKYAFGVWFSRYWPFSSTDYRQIVQEYGDHGFPLDIMVMDMDWHKDGWTGWSWNRKLLPDAEELLKWFHQQGLAVTLNVHPADGVGPHEDVYEPFMRALGDDPATKKTLPYDAGDKRYLDALFKYTHEPLEREGVDFWWLDWQQYPFTRSVPDLTNLAWLNHYYYQHTGQEGRRGMSFSRWAGWGDHRNPIHFSGDANTGWRMLAAEVPFTSTAGNMGCFFWSHDIGGHMGGRNEESYARWCQFGATTAALRSHSTRDAQMDRRPWLYSKWAEESMRVSFRLRSQLLPYVYSSAWESCRDAVPLNRPLYLEYSDQEPAYHNSQEYLFGDNLLAAPITMPGVGPGRVGWQTVWFPAGTWYNVFTGERYEGPADALVAADINEFPLFARAGVPVPMQPYTPRPGTAPLNTLLVRCYPGDDGRTGTFPLYEDDGLTTAYTRGESATTLLRYTRRGDRVEVNIAPTKGHFVGQPTERAYVIELPDTARATGVAVDGKPALTQYDPTTFTNRISIPARAITSGSTIVALAKPAGADVLRARAFARRTGLPTAVAGGKTVRQLLTAALDAARDQPARDVALAACGIGLFGKNETAYRYPETETPYLYAPADLLDGDTVKWGLEALSTSGDTVLAAQEGKLATITPVPTLTAAGPKRMRLCADISVAGRAVRVRGPLSHFDFTKLADDVARQAKVTVSSLQGGTSEKGVTDGYVDGYPNDQRFEWASGHETAGAWIRLAWDQPQTIDRVWLFDRPNLVDQVLAGELTLSDGTTYKVGELANDASEGVEVRFPPRQVSWMKFTITSSRPGTENTGLSEIVVMRPSPQ